MIPSAIIEDSEITPAEETRYAELQRLALDSARAGNSDLLLPMLQAGLPHGLVDEKGNCLLMLASYHGHFALTEALLKLGADPDQRNDRNQTPLAGVAFKGGLEIAKLLVQYGADPRADQGGGRFPEQFAAMFGNPEIVEFLQSLEPNARRRSGALRLLSKTTGFLRRRIRKEKLS